MNTQTKLFCASLASVILGAGAFLIGTFGRAGTWANDLSGLGVLGMAAGGVLSLICTVIATAALSSGEKMDWWYPLNLQATIGALWGGWVAIHL